MMIPNYEEVVEIFLEEYTDISFEVTDYCYEKIF